MVAVGALLAVGALGAGEGDDGASAAARLGAAIAASSPTTGVAAESARIVWPADLVCPSERSLKADQIEALGYAPEVVFFGGSRATRFEPSYLLERTGLTGFNLAMTNGKPEDAWVFAHLLHERAPETRMRWVWVVQVSTAQTRDLDAGLIQDPRLNRYLPAGLLRAQGDLLPRTPEEVPEAGRLERRDYSHDGAIVRNSYDRAEERGRTLAESLELYIPRAVERQEAAVARGDGSPRGRRSFEATLEYLDEIGAETVLVATPVHPLALEALRPGGWQERHERFVAYLDALHDRCEFEFIDLSEVDSIGGDPDDFYDGVHLKAANARRVIDTLIRAFPAMFEE